MVAEIFLGNYMTRKYWDTQEPWDRRTLAHLPAAHIAGIVNYFGSQMAEASTTYWMPKFNLEQFVKYVAQLKINTFFSVPPIYLAIAKLPAIKDQFLQMKQAIVGAAPISPELCAEANKKMPNLIISQVWGMSETTGAVTFTNLQVKEQAGSLGVLIPTMSCR